MPTPVFPYILTYSGKEQDASEFTVQQEDPAMRTEMEGGYVFTRARHTRVPRKTWTSSFKYIASNDKDELQTFWETVRGGSVIFQWRNPQDDQDYLVRFLEPLNFKYVGIKNNQRWDVSFKVQEA